MPTKWLTPKSLLPALRLKTGMEFAYIMQKDRRTHPFDGLSREIDFCGFFGTMPECRQFQETLKYSSHVH